MLILPLLRCARCGARNIPLAHPACPRCGTRWGWALIDPVMLLILAVAVADERRRMAAWLAERSIAEMAWTYDQQRVAVAVTPSLGPVAPSVAARALQLEQLQSATLFGAPARIVW